ncbi:hypothetical protein [Mycobacterium tuberculosis]|uniref:hypothetical protein n=2 Tax=Mycobacterium tuberculosis TaxID=1773 RepID=UPI0018659FDD|nr:hypothetical protein [Mycobacterium tuberculosis]
MPLAPDHTNPDTPRRMRYVTGDHAVQVFQLTSTVIDLTTKRKHTTVVYAATSMSERHPCTGSLLVAGSLRHAFENKLHRMRDVTYAKPLPSPRWSGPQG